MSKKPVKKQHEDPETTGHSWDGIEEFNNPLPRWWLWTFYATIIWGIAYTIAYPAWPLVNKATQGVLGYSTREEVAKDIASFNEANAEIRAKLVSTDLTEVENDADLTRFATAGGAAVFRTWCAQCHGSGAAGAVGYPNLLDDDWLWGGDIEAIYETVAHGIRNEDYDDARYSEMPKFGEILENEEIEQVVEYVLSISGQEHDATLASSGAVVYEDNCSACHAEDGTGDRSQGAPNLTDAIWLYGGDRESLTDTVVNARYGVMPGWSNRLSEADIRAVSFYVHNLGGGE
ncbi:MULTISPECIES: cytochrome-c oxidase, cbb3-type subunit III [Halocynthiibacter]|uniref:Cbb3-type cytochrome c oxidase subunit n=1 Tax=Halocynthiibacter halioticoli TaxID=2986804 RepID=A0AAE3IWM5_9RHOB|nr:MULTISPECIES: cytochrome-c oxidase, cbb3-type subunit III [Halocynthiibacter]MCV6823344.1 cytochrome-c oxidase, cbb3-type subunit III [Halocynthiibacter halioticoli]MCW4056345.1 cytochrome-c oxidase, cbb3-type subunit III [Halocynthiibacter sp. SDUM655004]